MMEGEYLELVNQLKLKYDDVEEKLISIENKNEKRPYDRLWGGQVIR